VASTWFLFFSYHNDARCNKHHITKYFPFRCVPQNFEQRLLVSSCLSVRPSDRIKQLGSNWADFHKIWYSSISWKICREKSSVVKIWQERQEIYAKNYRGADKSLAQPGKEKSSDTCQGRARFQQHRDASCHQVFSPPARQGAEGNSYHSDRNINLLPFWSG